MKTVFYFLLSFIFTHHINLFANEPPEEFRAVWLTTFAGLDWPNSYDVEEQKSSLLDIIERLHDTNFNAIVFQVRSRGDAFYRSQYEPWARELTGETGRDPGWDPLSFIIEQAHRRGIEVHAWFNVYKVWGGTPIPYGISPEHILERHPEWGRLDGIEWWLNPGEPGVHTHLLKVALDIIERYPVDGIHFDHIRYPGRDFDDALTYNRFGGGKDLFDWRRDNITNFVRDFYRYATAIRPDLKVGSAPVGVYRPIPGFYSSTAYVDYYQDPERWLREGIHDYIAPQVYWDIGENPKFENILFDWKNRAHNRHVYGGIGVYRPEVYDELSSQIGITRTMGVQGQIYFRYSHINNSDKLWDAYSTPVSLPPMPWKDSYPDFENIVDIAHLLDREIFLPVQPDPIDPDSFVLSFYVPQRSYVSIRITDEALDENILVADDFFDVGFHSISVSRQFLDTYVWCRVHLNGRMTERFLKLAD